LAKSTCESLPASQPASQPFWLHHKIDQIGGDLNGHDVVSSRHSV